MKEEALNTVLEMKRDACRQIGSEYTARPITWLAPQGSRVNSADETSPDASRAAVSLRRDRERLDMRWG